MIAAMAEGVSNLQGLSVGHDVIRTRDSVASLGAQIEQAGTGLDVRGIAMDWPHGADLDLGNSGTGMRLLAGVCATNEYLSSVTGDESLRSRPMGRVIEPLQKMGARIESNPGETAPLRIQGGRLNAIRYDTPIASAQVKSAVLLAGLRAEGPVTVTEEVATRRHTEEMFTFADIDFESGDLDGRYFVTVSPSVPRCFDFAVPGDPSQAAFWCVAAAITPGSEIVIDNVYVGPGRIGFVDVLRRMEADIDVSTADGIRGSIRVVGLERLRGTDISGDEVAGVIDELPVLAVAACLADGPSRVRDAKELAVKESNRIEATTSELTSLGAQIKALPDGFDIEGVLTLGGGSVSSHGDHRIAMACAVAALCCEHEVIIDNWSAAVDTSYPGFASVFEGLSRESCSVV